MSYIESTLSKDEEIKEVVKIHWFNYFISVIIPIVIPIFICLDKNLKVEDKILYVVILIILAIYNFLRLYTTEMVVTNKRIICKKGIIGVRTEELKCQKIESVEIKQDIGGRVWGYGTIYFSGTGTSKVKFENIDDPWIIKSRVETIIGNSTY